MKKTIGFVVMMLLCSSLAQAQHKIISFFDQMGAVALETQELKNDTVVTIFHRQDDVVWYRIVYNIVDLRYKQNYVMYYPTNFDNNRYKSLFGVMCNAIMEGIPVYKKPMQPSLLPHLEWEPLSRAEIPSLLELEQGEEDAFGGFDLGAMDEEEGMEGIDLAALGQTPSVMAYSPENDALSVTEYYDQFVRNQYKFLLQEIIFFDKHYSRLYRSVIAIAPLYAPRAQADANAYEAVYQQILFWLPFQKFRNYMKSQYILTSRNSAMDVSYDELFAKHLYTSYIVGEENMYDRMIPEYYSNEKDIKKEQQRIETELLNFEQDLWEY